MQQLEPPSIESRWLQRLDPDEPSETLWLTVHEDARAIPRVRALLDFLKAAFAEHAAAFEGRRPAASGDHAQAPR